MFALGIVRYLRILLNIFGFMSQTSSSLQNTTTENDRHRAPTAWDPNCLRGSTAYARAGARESFACGPEEETQKGGEGQQISTPRFLFDSFDFFRQTTYRDYLWTIWRCEPTSEEFLKLEHLSPWFASAVS